jgi:hypothetical protein
MGGVEVDGWWGWAVLSRWVVVEVGGERWRCARLAVVLRWAVRVGGCAERCEVGVEVGGVGREG